MVGEGQVKKPCSLVWNLLVALGVRGRSSAWSVVIAVGFALELSAIVDLKIMIVSLAEAVTILQKWKDDSTPVFILGQRSFRAGLWAVHEGGVDWSLALRAKVSQVSVSEGIHSTKRGVVVFEAAEGDVSVGMDACAFTYDQNCDMPEFVGAHGMRAHSCPSCLFIFLPSNETFVIYELDGI